MSDALVHRFVWIEAGIGVDDDGTVYAHDFGWRLNLGHRNALGVPEAFDP